MINDIGTLVGNNYDFYLALARNAEKPVFVPGHTRVDLRGVNYDVDVGTLPEDVWGSDTYGGGLYPFPSDNVTIEVVSSETSDTAAGTGAQEVRVTGVINSYSTVFEDVELDGTTPVVLNQEFYRINEVSVIRAGTNLENQGHIRVQVMGGGDVLGVIPPLQGLSSHAIYSIPRNFIGFIVGSLSSIQRANSNRAVIELKTRNGSTTTDPWLTRWSIPVDSQGNGSVPFPTVVPHPLPEMTDIRYTTTFVSASNTIVAIHAQMVLVRKQLYQQLIVEN